MIGVPHNWASGLTRDQIINGMRESLAANGRIVTGLNVRHRAVELGLITAGGVLTPETERDVYGGVK